MSVDERLVRSTSLLVVDLEGVGEDKRAVVLGKVLELGGGKVRGVGTVQELLGSGDGLLDGHRRTGRRGLLRLEERRAEGGDFVGLVEGDVRDRIRDGHAVHLLLEVDDTGDVALELGAEMNGLRIDADARLHEGNGGLLNRRVGALGQRVVDTIPERLEHNKQSARVPAEGLVLAYLVGRDGVVSLELEALANLAGAVGRVLRGYRVRDGTGSGGAKHRKVDGGKDLLEGEHV